MLLVPNDMRRRGYRTTEFWLCTACSVALAIAAIAGGSGAMGAAAAIPASVYCVCRALMKSRVGVDPAKLAPVDEVGL